MGCHKLSENIWFVWSKLSYCGEKLECDGYSRTECENRAILYWNRICKMAEKSANDGYFLLLKNYIFFNLSWHDGGVGLLFSLFEHLGEPGPHKSFITLLVLSEKPVLFKFKSENMDILCSPVKLSYTFGIDLNIFLTVFYL